MTELFAVDERVFQVRKDLDRLFEAGSLTQDLYFKGLMLLAYEYAVENFPEEALEIVLEIDETYFRNTADKQMREDVEFFQRAALVYRSLLAAGLTPFAFNVIPQKQALA
jgi:hypothetical protein